MCRDFFCKAPLDGVSSPITVLKAELAVTRSIGKFALRVERVTLVPSHWPITA